MRLTKNKLKLLNPAIQSAVALLVLSGGNVVHAQDTGAAPVATSEEAVNKVVVTARRREETLQDVPVSVTAFSADQLSKVATPDITALAVALPNTTLKASRATNSTLTAFIRGVGQADPLAGFEAGVGIYIDDIYLARPQAAVADIYDVERIEVLRGPQGTLYGRNTIGGAVKYVTRKLAPKTDARLRATIGEFGQKEIVATASTPISETARIGGTFARFKRDGFGKNLTTGGENYDKDVTAARLSAEFTPNQDLFIRIAGDLTQDDSSPKNGHRLIVGRTSGAPILGNVFDTRANLMKALGQDQEVKAHGVSATVEYTINNEWSVKSITASRKDKSYAPIDFDSLAVVDMEVPALYTNKQFSQEFNLTYNGERLQGVAGIYYIDANAFNKFDTILAGAVPTSTFTSGDIDTKAWAIYADGSYQLTDGLSLSLGGRYTVDQRDAEVLRQIYLGAAGSPGLGNPSAILFRTDTDLRGGVLSRKDKKFTPRVALNYKMNADHNVYASYSEGFKGGGFDPRLNVVGTRIPLAVARAGYAPETIETYELGLKSAFNRGRITTNAAVFYSDYQDVQIPGSVAIDTNGDGRDDSFAGVTTNAGKAKIKGAELEAVANLTPNFMVAGMYSYIDAEYKEYFSAGVNVASARTFQNTPKNSANLRVNYDIPLPIMGHGGKISLIGSASYKGATAQFETASLIDQESYKLYDVSIVWTRTDGRVRAGLHGKNLGDKHYKTGGYLFPTLGNEGTLTAFYGNPRQVSATLEYRF
ncbi:TonB-dependent receptor [Massilia yuzhufengensis]|uniref:Iron complex outermembrane recepter protein n=1 Tax=Massilia yuzhufengensis TaxID=1164594 RepID=A0A1I1EUM3_9BURK|nr:TonB-dependent receptor [Massilia yuzhufengensis]SFB90741.1 iron complex outermembrane recepter protein [Massilia yuzhufengensis]